MEGLSRKLYLKLPAPTEADSRSSEARILSALRELGYEARMTLKVMRKLYPLCEKAGWLSEENQTAVCMPNRVSLTLLPAGQVPELS